MTEAFWGDGLVWLRRDTMWVSICPPGTNIVSGSCIATVGGAVSLQSFGMDTERNSCECLWTHSVPKASVRAYCSRTQ